MIYRASIRQYMTPPPEYNPVSGRWNRLHRMGFAAGDTNLYRYVGNSPTEMTDPSGLDVTDTPSNDYWFYDDDALLGALLWNRRMNTESGRQLFYNWQAGRLSISKHATEQLLEQQRPSASLLATWTVLFRNPAITCHARLCHWAWLPRPGSDGHGKEQQ